MYITRAFNGATRVASKYFVSSTPWPSGARNISLWGCDEIVKGLTTGSSLATCKKLPNSHNCIYCGIASVVVDTIADSIYTSIYKNQNLKERKEFRYGKKGLGLGAFLHWRGVIVAVYICSIYIHFVAYRSIPVTATSYFSWWDSSVWLNK